VAHSTTRQIDHDIAYLRGPRVSEYPGYIANPVVGCKSTCLFASQVVLCSIIFSSLSEGSKVAYLFGARRTRSPSSHWDIGNAKGPSASELHYILTAAMKSLDIVPTGSILYGLRKCTCGITSPNLPLRPPEAGKPYSEP